MADLQCLKIRIKPGRTRSVVEWIRGLPDRDLAGLNEVLASEGMIVESIFLERTTDADYLILYQRAEDLERANRVFQASTHPVDEAVREFIAENWEAATPLQLLADHERVDGGYVHAFGAGDPAPAD